MNLFLYILLIAHLWAVNVVPTGLKQTTFTYQEACDEFGYKELILIEPVDGHNLDCMSKTISLTEFCKKKISKTGRLLRGVAVQEKRLVLCEEGDALELNIICDGDRTKYCKEPEKECLRLRELYAKELELTHSSKTVKSKFYQLNCYYSLPLKN